ncbi:MAG: glycosyltransferase family 4 protein [Cyclobacterium sp.]|uniref:glycosyltransferase family 4 protein n=1 Tax=unclassified Cyclobacterium TaxID=2615055 RepID=UPI0013D8A790|nr:glycosyltransferase family 4 protein [Cyclobacterium sp. SYSU L10401]
MRIIYIHQYYLTPGQGGAIRSYHLTQGMSAEGLKVEVITAHNGRNYDIRWDGKVKVHLLPVPYDNKFNTFQRLWSFYSFVRQAKSLVNKENLPDLFYITSTPLSTGEIGIWARKKWGIPFVFEVRDLWPEAPVQVKQIRNRLLKKWLYGREYKIYRKASGIVALSPGIQDYVKKLVPEKNVEMVPNFSDTDFFSRKETGAQKRDFVSQPMTLIYAGAIGEVNGLYQYLELAAAAKKHRKNWRFQLMGRGNQLKALKREAKAKSLDRVEFIPFGDKFEVRERMKKADFAYISFLPLKVLELSSPNKFFDALAMGLPVVVNFKGWIWDLIEGNGIGFYHDCFNHESLIASLEILENSPELVPEMNFKARKLAEKSFDKRLMISRILKIVEGLGKPSDPTSPGLVS